METATRQRRQPVDDLPRQQGAVIAAGIPGVKLLVIRGPRTGGRVPAAEVTVTLLAQLAA